MNTKMNIGFIGLGKLGLPSAEVFATKFTVFGYDVEPRTSDNITILDSLEAVVKICPIIFVAVQTPHDTAYGGVQSTTHLPAKNFDYTFIKEVIQEINLHIKSEQSVVIISTVLPGTMRNELKPLLTKGNLLYNPYLIAMGTVKEDMVNPEMIIIGSENGNNATDFSALKKLYDKFVQPDTRFETGTWEEAESIKIFYNTFISAKIAIVNMIQDVAENIGNMNVDVVTNALSNSTKRIISKAYMKAGMGDGGPCHPRDNIALSWLAQKLELNYDLFNAINFSREQQAKNVADKLISFGKPVVILGTNYKPNVALTDGSYALLIASFIKEKNHEVYLNMHPDEMRSYTYLLSHENIYNDFPFIANSIVLDIWRSFETNRNDITVVQYGNTKQL